METYCEVQEEALSIEKERYEKMKENLEKLSKTYLFLERKYKTTVEKLQNEGNDLRKIIEELKKDCDDLRLINAERIANDEQSIKINLIKILIDYYITNFFLFFVIYLKTNR